MRNHAIVLLLTLTPLLPAQAEDPPDQAKLAEAARAQAGPVCRAAALRSPRAAAQPAAAASAAAEYS